MSHLQSYSDQLGGFDFSLTQRYAFPQLEISFSRKKKLLNHCLTKRQVQPLSVSSSMVVLCLLLIPEQLEDRLSSKRTARRSTILLLTSTHVVPALLLIPNLSISSCHPTSSCNASTQAGRPEWAHTLQQLQVFCTDMRGNSAPIWLWEAMMF